MFGDEFTCQREVREYQNMVLCFNAYNSVFITWTILYFELAVHFKSVIWMFKEPLVCLRLKLRLTSCFPYAHFFSTFGVGMLLKFVLIKENSAVA